MDCKELRIGNIVSFLGTKVKVKTIEPDTNVIKMYEPIPLTEEILLKCGFEKRQESEAFYYFGYGENPMTRDWMLCLKYFKDDNKFFYLNGYFKIIYVHQIQNLYFALTNEELIINL